jgi:ribosomal protein S18 acetylase RimI-like enzyme
MTRQLLAFFPMRAALGAIRRALHTAPLVKPVSRDMLYVANLGVATDARGQGVGQALLRQQMQRAREMGKQRFALDVAVTNPRAQKLYESLGLKFVNEKAFGGDSTRLAVPASRRLELLLT